MRVAFVKNCMRHNECSNMLKHFYQSSVLALCDNAFQPPNITELQKEKLDQAAFAVLAERKKYPSKTLAQLYDPTKVPDDLTQVHRDMD